MPHVSKRAGQSQICVCSHCNSEFLTRRKQPFCSAKCKHESGYTSQAKQNTSQPILEGAIQHDIPNQNRC
jgi:uncharacterized Zn ribbon protein